MRAQASLEALVSMAAFLAFLLVLLRAIDGVSEGAVDEMALLRMQSTADGLALQANFLAGDAAFTSTGGLTMPAGCSVAREQGMITCVNGSSRGAGPLYSGTEWGGYGEYNRFPV